MAKLNNSEFLILSVVEAIYVVYMMNFFKTRYSLAHPFTYFENKMLYHPIGTSEKPICNICPLGNYGSMLLAVYIILRYLVYTRSSGKTSLRMFSALVLGFVFLLSLLNFNAVVYLIPYFVIEIYLIRNML